MHDRSGAPLALGPARETIASLSPAIAVGSGGASGAEGLPVETMAVQLPTLSPRTLSWTPTRNSPAVGAENCAALPTSAMQEEGYPSDR